MLTEALRRYEQLWLPLLAAAKAEGATATLVPPLDVAFVWHLHRLQPAAYAADTAAVAGAKGQPLMVHPEQVGGGQAGVQWGGVGGGVRVHDLGGVLQGGGCMGV